MDMFKKPFSMQLDVSDFLPADDAEKKKLTTMRKSIGFWRDGLRRFRKNKIAMTAFFIIIIITLLAFVGPIFYPYSYEEQVRGSENLAPMEYSPQELLRMDAAVFLGWSKEQYGLIADTDAYSKVEFIGDTFNIKSNTTLYAVWGIDVDDNGVCDLDVTPQNVGQAAAQPEYDAGRETKYTVNYLPNNGEGTVPVEEQNFASGDTVSVKVNTGLTKTTTEKIFPHLLGTDTLGRDTVIRLMMGSRISLLVGIIASFLILVIGSIYGAAAGYFGGMVDMIMMRLVDIIYSVPDILVIIMLMVTLKYPLKAMADNLPGMQWINTIGIGLICIFIVFALLYWVGMARIVRTQILTLKEQEYVTAARALGANSGRIIRRHLLVNCIGTLIVTTTLGIPGIIFTESFLSFIGLGVSAPMPSLGSMASDAIGGLQSYPYRLLAPAIVISLIILSFNLFGDGLRDAFDPKLKD
jgi:ABC-type dipeptide/oligopeptide/nickel transport systems, permease components